MSGVGDWDRDQGTISAWGSVAFSRAMATVPRQIRIGLDADLGAFGESALPLELQRNSNATRQPTPKTHRAGGPLLR